MPAISSSIRAVASTAEGMDDDEEGDDGDDDYASGRIAPLLASIVMRALRRLEGEGGKMLSSSSSSDDRGDDDGDNDDVIRCKADRDVLLILGLVSSRVCFVIVRSSYVPFRSLVLIRPLASLIHTPSSIRCLLFFFFVPASLPTIRTNRSESRPSRPFGRPDARRSSPPSRSARSSRTTGC